MKKDKTHIKIPDRIDKVITLLPHSKSKKEAMLKAGYSATTAQTKHTSLNKNIEKRLIAYMKEDIPTDKFFNIEEMLKEYEYLCKQNKDLSTKYRAITSVLSKYPDIISTNGTSEHNAPILNITVRNIEELPQNSPQTIKIDPIMEDISIKEPQENPAEAIIE